MGIRAKGAAIFIDGRYTLQVRDQVPAELYDYEGVPGSTPAKWLAEHAQPGARIGYDPWLHPQAFVKALDRALAKKDGAAVAVEDNPIDAIWSDQPGRSTAPAKPHADAYAGRSSADKRQIIADGLKQAGQDAAVIAALDSVAWLLNIRGEDIDNTPLTLGFALAHADGTAELFIAPEKVTPELAQHLGNSVTVRDRGELVPALRALKGQTIAVDPERSVMAILHALEEAGATVVEQTDPTVLARAIKNRVEQQGHRDAQARDGAAMVKFLHWLDVEARKGAIDELAAAARLKSFRAQDAGLKGISFDTISGAGPNAAICHYRVNEDSNRLLEPGSIYLVDSGGQYLEGTTDVTRTVWIDTPDGTEPTAEMKDRYTRVLKGHIALDRAVFPEGTGGAQLDVLARQFLWEAGIDYPHGTGHGVGSYLSVHEGPQRIAKPGGGYAGTNHALHAGMILSNEPGYYKDGAYGIRIENLLLVEPREINGAEGQYLGFETLTFVPIDRRLIDPAMLAPHERLWLDAYHARVWELISSRVENETRKWLKVQCTPLPS